MVQNLNCQVKNTPDISPSHIRDMPCKLKEKIKVRLILSFSCRKVMNKDNAKETPTANSKEICPPRQLNKK